MAVHVLDVGDHALAELFGGSTGDEVDKFAHCEWTRGPGGVPLLSQCCDRIVLERTSLWDDEGDHVCLVGAPVDVTVGGELEPLRISDAKDIQAGHPAGEAPAGPAVT